MVKVNGLSDLKGGDDDDDDRGVHDASMPVDGEKMSSDFHGIYHEKQIGALCAVHAMNNLVQSRRYDEVELSVVALELDAREAEALGGATLKGEDSSGNVRADGFFSVQVIVEALQRDGFTCLPATPTVVESPGDERGFILNRREHWFSLRRIEEQWFDLNSMFAAPKHLTKPRLGAFVEQMRQSGYSIYVVRGTYPTCPRLERDPAALQRAVDACEYQAGGPAPAASASSSFAAFSGAGNTLVKDDDEEIMVDPELAAMAAADPELAEAIAMSLSSQLHTKKKNKPVRTAKDDADEIRLKRLARFNS